jgi:hypothetical protein
MATKNTADSTVEEKDATVPHQAKASEATVTEIRTSDGDVTFFGEDDTKGSSFLVVKAKRLAKNKRVIAGAVTTAILGTAVLVIRKRNSAVEETDETPEA